MAEYIERQALLKFIENGLNNPDKTKAFGYDAVEIMTEVQYAPAADVVEVVRCKDCIKCVHDKIFGHYWCNRMNSTYKVKPDDFCSYGEQREGDTDA